MAILLGCSMLTNAQSWNGCAVKMPHAARGHPSASRQQSLSRTPAVTSGVRLSDCCRLAEGWPRAACGIFTAQPFQLCALVSIEHPSSIAITSRLPVQAHPTAQHLFTDTDLGRYMRHRLA